MRKIFKIYCLCFSFDILNSLLVDFVFYVALNSSEYFEFKMNEINTQNIESNKFYLKLKFIQIAITISNFNTISAMCSIAGALAYH